MWFDILVCTNLVNYTVALHGARAGQRRPALLLYEPWRFAARPQRGVVHLKRGIWAWRLLQALVAVRLVHTVYLPHDRVHRRLLWCRDHAPRRAYLDDGLDTHRRQPRNFDPLPPGLRPRYLTFSEFTRHPDWLEAYAVEGCCPLAELARATAQPPLPLQGVRHVLVESPGLDVARLLAVLALPPEQVLVVRHPVPDKRGTVPDGLRCVEGRDHNLEATLLTAEGCSFYLGETLALVFAAFGPTLRHNRVLAMLSQAQRANLPGLQWDAPSAAEAEVGVWPLAASVGPGAGTGAGTGAGIDAGTRAGTRAG